jgi:hypothetical protein
VVNHDQITIDPCQERDLCFLADRSTSSQQLSQYDRRPRCFVHTYVHLKWRQDTDAENTQATLGCTGSFLNVERLCFHELDTTNRLSIDGYRTTGISDRCGVLMVGTARQVRRRELLRKSRFRQSCRVHCLALSDLHEEI